MGRPKGSKNKPTTAPPKARAKAKAKPPRKAEPPDWLRKAMEVKTPTKAKVGRKPNAIKEKFKAIAQKGRRHMTISKDKPLADPLDDPDLGYHPPAASVMPSPPKQPVKGAKPDNTLPDGSPVPGLGPDGKPKGTPVAAEREEEPAPKFDEVQSGAEIPPENAELLIAGTLGGSGDHHALSRRILERFVEVNWVINKGLDAGSGDTKPGDGGPGGAYRPGQLPWQKPVLPGTLPTEGLPGTKPVDPEKPQLGGGKPGKPAGPEKPEIGDKPSFGDKPGPGR